MAEVGSTINVARSAKPSKREDRRDIVRQSFLNLDQAAVTPYERRKRRELDQRRQIAYLKKHPPICCRGKCSCHEHGIIPCWICLDHPLGVPKEFRTWEE